MGGRTHRAAALGVSLALGLAARAAADPIFMPPVIGDAHWGGGEKDAALLGLIFETRALGVLGASRLAAWPDRGLGVEPGTPQLVDARAGLVLHLLHVPLSAVARADLSEPNRPAGQEAWGAELSAIVDDLYLDWRPAQAAELIAGRARLPWSKYRQYEEVDEPLPVPFVVDRVSPDRRWGLTFLGDLGALAYAAGVYEDLDELEPRLRPEDPSQQGALATMAQIEWTPVAPMMGSEPPGKVIGARGPLPTPRADPWFDTLRPSLGLGTLVRVREDGSLRVDTVVSGQLKWRALAALSEVIISREESGTTVGAYGDLYFTPIDRLALVMRGEWDPGAGREGEWAAGGGAIWHVTVNRRNKIGVFGWLRRDISRGTPYDGVVVLLQASL